MTTFDPIDDILAEIRAGRMVVIMDDEDRENEGDLIMAAECVRPEDVNFMARYGRGLICLTLTRERCRALQAAADGQRHQRASTAPTSRSRSRPPRA